MESDEVFELYEFVQMNLFFGDETLSLRRSYNPLVLFTILTSLLNGRELIFGDYGSGKTTSAERISSLTKAVPLEFIQASTIHGHPEQTEEKLKATLDLAALEKEGKEVIRWKLLPFSPAIIIDEINRLPVGKQSMILNEVDRNIWSYRGETLIFEEGKPFFGTINYQDAGTTLLIPPLLDRFDIAVETTMLHPVRKRLVRRGVDDSILRDPKLAKEMIDYIMEMNFSEKADEIVRYVDEVSSSFREVIEERAKRMGFSLSIPTKREAKEIRREIESYPISTDFELLMDYLGQEIYCHLGMHKDFSKCNGCHYANYVCSDLYAISNRAEKSVMLYSKAVAWWNGDEEADIQHLISVLPFALWHRTEISDRKRSEIRDIEKDVSDEFFAVRDSLMKVKKRWEEHRNLQIEAYNLLKKGDEKELERIAELVAHPFFKSLLRG
ncbi:MAG: hypothetical protein H0Z28_08085 [Archaeoglobus sp.]|nr:hypothetical protein [Archaeoglobus sp.]